MWPRPSTATCGTTCLSRVPNKFGVESNFGHCSMKLRIQGNSLRLRLTQPEVSELAGQGRVESRIEFAPRHSLTYAVESSPQAPSVSAHFRDNAIVVTVPATTVKDWAEGEQITIEGAQSANFQVLVEKDFQCLHKPEKRDPDAYPHPLASEQVTNQSPFRIKNR